MKTRKAPRNSGAAILRDASRRKFCGQPMFPGMTLAELRDRRDMAVGDGDMRLAFALACEIDKKRMSPTARSAASLGRTRRTPETAALWPKRQTPA